MAASIRNARYFEIEYFNPLQNGKRFHDLLDCFGCELASGYQNIAADVPQWRIDRCISRTWLRDDYTFTKEVFSPYKLPLLVEHFQCAVLLSESSLVFPPTRRRIYVFYEHAARAIRETGRAFVPSVASLHDTAVAAHDTMAAALYRDAIALHVPVIHYRDTLTGNLDALRELCDSLRWSQLDSDAAAARLFATRRLPPGRESAVA